MPGFPDHAGRCAGDRWCGFSLAGFVGARQRWEAGTEAAAAAAAAVASAAAAAPPAPPRAETIPLPQVLTLRARSSALPPPHTRSRPSRSGSACARAAAGGGARRRGVRDPGGSDYDGAGAVAAGRFPPARASRLLTAGARASARPPRPRRRVPLSRRAGAQDREERSRARSRCKRAGAWGAGRGAGAAPADAGAAFSPWSGGPRRGPGGKKIKGVGFDRAGYQSDRWGFSSRRSQDTFPCSPFGQLLAVSGHLDPRLLGKVSEQGRPSHRPVKQ